MTRLLTIFPFVLLSACVSPKKPVEYRPTSASTPVVEFGFGGAFSNQTRLIADGTRVCEEIYRQQTSREGITSYVLHTQREFTPSIERWATFWGTVTRLQVSAWKPNYSARELGAGFFEGTQWHLTFATERGTKKIHGDNAYPTIGHPKQTTLNSAAYDELYKAFETLLSPK